MTGMEEVIEGGSAGASAPLERCGRLLMCAPDHYDVDYVINPWMQHNVGRIDRKLAGRQWKHLHHLLSDAAELEMAPPAPGLPDMVFTANAGLAIDRKVVVSRFQFGERRSEEALFKSWFEENGFAVAPWPEDVSFEGAGDALLDRGRALIWCGYGFRSSVAAPRFIAEIFDRETAPLRLVDPRFYHLDTCFCPLSEGRLLYFPRAFDPVSQEKIAAVVPAEQRIEASERDAAAFACNAVQIGGRIFMNEASEDLQSRLRAAGFAPILSPLSEFLKSGGAAKCLTLNLSER
jgi:N-dimethylarginine dimethylaminohydrolase